MSGKKEHKKVVLSRDPADYPPEEVELVRFEAARCGCPFEEVWEEYVSSKEEDYNPSPVDPDEPVRVWLGFGPGIHFVLSDPDYS